LAQVGVGWIQLANSRFLAIRREKLESPHVDSYASKGRQEFSFQRTKQIKAGLKPAMAIWSRASLLFSMDALVHYWSLLQTIPIVGKSKVSFKCWRAFRGRACAGAESD